MTSSIRYRRFIAKNLGFIVERLYKMKFMGLNFVKPPIIILTIGKVGSSSIYETLRTKTTHKIYHIHNISEEGIRNSIQSHLNSDRRSKPLHLIISKLLREKLILYSGRLLVITVVREPISREVSSFFQNIDFYKNTLENKNLEIDMDKSYNMLLERLNTKISKIHEDWFKLEIEGNYDIDVFSESFNEAKKYMIFEQRNTKLLLLRMEDLNEVFPEAIKEFLNLDKPIKLQNTNLGNQKHYADTYKKIKEKLKLDSVIVNQIINSKFFRHFYSNYRDEIIKKWTKRY